MEGVFKQASYDVIEEGIKRRMRNASGDVQNNNGSTTKDSCYLSSQSKSRILNSIECSEIIEEESAEEINKKKLKLVESLRIKLSELEETTELLENEKKENDLLGASVLKLVKEMFSSKEQGKYENFVREVDNIVKLLISLCGRITRVDKSMLQCQQDSRENAKLKEKKKMLLDQHNEAKLLKQETDKKQLKISEMLASKFNQEQFADYEHFVKMKSALIVEKREFEEQMKVGKEQIQALIDSLPDGTRVYLQDEIDEL